MPAIIALLIGIIIGTVVTLAFVSGARRTGPHLASPFEPILRTKPRERTDRR